MTELKVGDVGYMKLTGEPAFVLEIQEEGCPKNEEALGPFVVVRLTGTSSKGPATYPTKDVRMAELESLEERARRDFRETRRIKKLAQELADDSMVELPQIDVGKVLPN